MTKEKSSLYQVNMRCEKITQQFELYIRYINNRSAKAMFGIIILSLNWKCLIRFKNFQWDLKTKKLSEETGIVQYLQKTQMSLTSTQ